MPASKTRASEIYSFYELNGEDKTIEHYGIKRESLYRYIRIYKAIKGEVRVFEEPTTPKILILDMETSPLVVKSWSLWQKSVSHNQIVRDWSFLTYSVKWLFDKEVYSGALTPEEALIGDDKRLVTEVWKFIDKADAVVAHNGVRFDIPRLNTRFVVHGLNPPLPYKIIDPLVTLKKDFAFSSNRLDNINRQLELDRKIDTGGHELWDRCMNGDSDALKEMEEYNANDVLILEQTYLAMRPWLRGHPNLSLLVMDDVSVCPKCASKELEWGGHYITQVNKYTTFRCVNCGCVGRSRVTELTKKDRANLVSNIV